MTAGKTIALTRWTFVNKVMSLLFNMLSRLVITFLLRSKHLLISWLQSPSAVILEPKNIKSATVSSFPICHEVMGPNAMILVFWMLSFKQLFHSPLLLSSRGSLFSAIRVVSSIYLRLLIFLPAILLEDKRYSDNYPLQGSIEESMREASHAFSQQTYLRTGLIRRICAGREKHETN